MPRQNLPRSIGRERVLAERLKYERRRRDLGVDALARLMTEAGCPIRGTAIRRIEDGDPPRTIGVDELAALAEIFEDGDVGKMLRSVEEVQLERAGELLAKLQGRNRQLAKLIAEMFNDFVDLAVVWDKDEDIYSYVMGYFKQSPLGADPGHDAGEVDEPADGAQDALVYLLSDIGARTWHAVSSVTLMYMNTLIGQERGEGPSEEELKQWVAEWSAKRDRKGFPKYEEARERLISRVEEWTERMRAENGVNPQEA